MFHSRSGLLSGLAVPIALLWAGLAQAEEPIVVTLIDMSVDGAAQAEIAHDVARAIRRNEQLRFRDVNETLNVGGEDHHVSNVRSAQGLLRSALNRMKVKEYQDAAEELESAVTNLSISFSHVPDQDLVSEVMLLHGAAMLLSGEAKSAHKAFIRASEFRPKFEVKPILEPYGAAVLAAYNKAHTEVLNRDMITYEITSKPPHAEVWVNGSYFGLTPTFVKRFKGSQFIRLNKHGYARYSKVLVTQEPQTVAIELVRARRWPAYVSAKGRLDEVFDGAVEGNDLSEAGGMLNAGRAVILRATGTRDKMQIKLALANLSGRQVVRRLSREIKWLRRDKDAIEKLVLELFKTPDLPIGAQGPEVRTESVFSKWWFWGVVGGVAAGSIAAWMLLDDTATPPPKYAPGTGGLIMKF